MSVIERKISPNKIKSVLKWSISEPTSDLSHLDKLWLYWWAKLCRAKFASGKTICGRNFRHLSKNSSLSPDKVSPDKVPFIVRDIYFEYNIISWILDFISGIFYQQVQWKRFILKMCIRFKKTFWMHCWFIFLLII